MAKQPLTPTGVQSKQNELYALSDPDLKTQADIIHTDFRNWIKDNFELSTEQENYLNALDDGFVRATACNTGVAVENRLLITLAVVGMQTASKLVRTRPQAEFVFNPGGGGFTATGSLTIEFEYL